MNRKTYLLHDNAHERLRSIPMIQPPQSLDGPLRELFMSQEDERYKLRMKHLVEKEKLVLAVEQVRTIPRSQCLDLKSETDISEFTKMMNTINLCLFT